MVGFIVLFCWLVCLGFLCGVCICCLALVCWVGIYLLFGCLFVYWCLVRVWLYFYFFIRLALSCALCFYWIVRFLFYCVVFGRCLFDSDYCVCGGFCCLLLKHCSLLLFGLIFGCCFCCLFGFVCCSLFVVVLVWNW